VRDGALGRKPLKHARWLGGRPREVLWIAPRNGFRDAHGVTFDPHGVRWQLSYQVESSIVASGFHPAWTSRFRSQPQIETLLLSRDLPWSEDAGAQQLAETSCAWEHTWSMQTVPLPILILFAEKEEELQKLILRQHRAVAVDRVVERAGVSGYF
jgi:hypothetical protein